MNVRAWRRLEAGLGILAIVVGLSTGQLWMWYARTEPREPEPRTGHEIRLETHGSTVFITRREQLLLNGGQALVILAFGIAIWIDVSKHPFRRQLPSLT